MLQNRHYLANRRKESKYTTKQLYANENIVNPDEGKR